MDIAIQKNTPVSIHQQLVTQISLQIASGVLPAGAKLPSIRALSQKLGIHHNTCLAAYKHLDEQGLIELRHGSGARVRSLEPGSQKVQEELDMTGLPQLANFFVEQVLRKGYAWDEAVRALEAARGNLAGQVESPLTFVDVHPDILPLFKAELQALLARPISAATIPQLEAKAAQDSHFIVSRYHIGALRDRLNSLGVKSKDKITMIDVGSVQQEIEVVKSLPMGALIVVVSVSTIILQQAEAVITALRGDEVLIRPVHYEQEGPEETRKIMQRAQGVFADFICTPQLQAMTRKAIYPVRVIPDAEVKKLQAFKR